MIKIEHVETAGWEAALRGMRNPMNSWAKGDTDYKLYDSSMLKNGWIIEDVEEDHVLHVGTEDERLCMNLRNAGVEHRKYMRMIAVWCDITAPLYWWKQFDTYKVGTVANSCSTMHKIHAKEFTRDDFSCEDLLPLSLTSLDETINILNFWRYIYLNGGNVAETKKVTWGDRMEMCDCNDIAHTHYYPEDPIIWLQLIKLLPDEYNQKRTVMLNYEVLAKMYKERRHHKLQEWHDICDWMKTLPASELIVGEE